MCPRDVRASEGRHNGLLGRLSVMHDQSTMPRVCSVPECGRPVLARDWCKLHYQRWWLVNGRGIKDAPPCAVADCGRTAKSRGYCHSHYTKLMRYGDPLFRGPVGRPPDPVEERFFRYVDKTSSPFGCWLWTGTLLNGYGLFSFKKKNFKAHRFAYALLHGPIPPNYHVAHNCPGGDNKACCNPAHMLLLTPQEHALDATLKGQRSTGDKSGSRTHPESLRRGNNHPNAKLTDHDVINIRERHASGRHSYVKLGLAYGVSNTCIRSIVRRDGWKHIP